MASGRPPGSHPAAGRDDDLLLDSGPMYSTGQGPPVNDEHLLERYNIDDSEQPYAQTQPRPSVSYDNFVGSSAQQGAAQHNVASGPAHPPVTPVSIQMTPTPAGREIEPTPRPLV
ncbi:unnamed protein product [Penicillium nalgiovense]|nr:unnamed protein product [Penicillium nalgiovense]